MSNFIKSIRGTEYYCIDGYFGGREYGYIPVRGGKVLKSNQL